jgi:1,2-diacylglycerol 3-alpha-glucosyltransferase
MYTQRLTADIRSTYQIPEKAPLMLSISRLAYEKNLSQVVDWMPKILEQVPNAMLMIVGDGPAKDDLMAQVHQLQLDQHVVFTGEISNDHVNAFYRAADVFVSASESESQGLTYIEAMAAGLPVVVTASDYTNNLLSSETLGSTFENADGYVEAVTRYLQSPIENDTAKAHGILQQKLDAISAETFGKRVIDFYRSVTVEQALSKDPTANID